MVDKLVRNTASSTNNRDEPDIMTLADYSTSLYGEAVTCEEEGKFGEAAERYALAAFADLYDADFRPGRSMRISFALILAAISADIRADNDTRPQRLFTTMVPLYESLLDTTDDIVLKGMLQEWFGDAWLMLGDDRAITWYQHAKQVYEAQAEPGRNWAFEEEFDYAYWAFEAFTELNGRSLPNNAEFDFERRIEFKLNFATDLVTN